MDVDNTLGAIRTSAEARVASLNRPSVDTTAPQRSAGTVQSQQGNLAKVQLSDQAQQSATAQTDQQSQARESNREQVDEAVINLNDFVQNISRDLSFKIDEDAGQVVVKVTDQQTGETIRQIPSEEALELAERLSEARSLMFEAKA